MSHARLLLAALALAAAPGYAQTTYRGYDTGPDYGAMIQEQQRRQQQMNGQMQQQEAAIVQGAMQDPRCQMLYQQHRAQGGALSFPQFAYECARTGRFTPEGMATADQAERGNRQAEQNALRGVREAEANRGRAQAEYMDRFGRNNAEAGNGLMGQGSYGNPVTGNNQVLQNTRPGVPTYDPATGQTFVMDQQGNYFVQTPGGWVPMQPRY